MPSTSPRRGLPPHALAALLVLAATPATGALASAGLGGRAACGTPAVDSHSAARLEAMVNAVRVKAGQRPLSRTHWLQHEFRGGRLSWAPTSAWAGENLAVAASPRAAMTAMLASPIHRTVLLFGRWRTIGIGARASCDGQTIYALDFLG